MSYIRVPTNRVSTVFQIFLDFYKILFDFS